MQAVAKTHACPLSPHSLRPKDKMKELKPSLSQHHREIWISYHVFPWN